MYISNDNRQRYSFSNGSWTLPNPPTASILDPCHHLDENHSKLLARDYISILHIRPHSASERPYLALGLEGSANKLGAGVIQHLPSGDAEVLSNVRHTYITPPGEGFLPRDTALHHRQWALKVIKNAMEKAKISMKDLDCICYTKGTFHLHDVASIDLSRICRPRNGCPIAKRSVGGTYTLTTLQQASCRCQSLCGP